MNKRKLFAFSTAALMALTITSCGSSSDDELNSKVSDNSGGSKIIEMWSRGNETDTHAPSLIQALKDFGEEKGVEVKYQFIPHDDAPTKWNAAFASSTAPDVMDIGISHMIERINLKHIVPLNEYVETREGKDDIYPAMLDLGSYKDDVYAIAHFPDPQIFAYRKDKFEEAGLDPESPPKNWEQMLEYAEKLTERDDGGKVTFAGYAMPTQGARFVANIMIRQNGSLFADEENNQPTMVTPEATETFEYMNELYQYTTVFDNGKTDTHPLINNSGAMGYIPNGVLSNYLKNNPDMADKFGFASNVPGKESAAWCGVWFYTMTSQADDPDLAWDLIAHLTSTEVLEARVEEAGLPATFESVSKDFIEKDPAINTAIMDAVSVGAGNPKVSWSNLYEQELDAALESLFYGEKTAEEALTEAQNNLLKEID